MQATTTPAPFPAGVPVRQEQWSGGRIAALVIGSIFGLLALAGLVGGGTALVLDQAHRDASGYVMTGSDTFSTGTYAFVSDSYRGGTSEDIGVWRSVLGMVRIRVNSDRPAFIGIARPEAVATYLAGVRRELHPSFAARRSHARLLGTGAPPGIPAAQTFWAAKAVGSGEVSLSWRPSSGSWRVVLMNADASRGVDADVSVGARFPNLLWISLGMLGGGALALLLAGACIYPAAVRNRKSV